MALKILVEGKKIPMLVTAWDYHKQMLVKPSVGSSELEMGIVIQLFDERKPDACITSRFWALVSPHNLICSWRGMLILEQMLTLGDSDMCDAYYAGQRNPHQSDKERVDKVRRKIGDKVYESILNQKIPDEISNLFVELTDKGDSVALWPITEEVRAGTLQWREDFKRIGAKHPSEEDARKTAEEKLLHRYDKYLSDYASEFRYERECMIMWGIEGTIVDAYEKGVEQDYGQDIALGIAIVRAHGGVAAMAASFFSHGRNPNAVIDQEVDKETINASNWLVKQFTKGLLKKPLHTAKEYATILTQLNENWNSLPVTHLLN
ncbi:MAG: hypothetical protein WAV51_02150 [Microgenomates group bacterium]